VTQPGYRIDRDDRNLTAREREVLTALVWSTPLTVIASELGVSKQRIDQIVRSLEKKGIVQRDGESYVVQVPR
jgi:predicted transcriptional regulator